MEPGNQQTLQVNNYRPPPKGNSYKGPSQEFNQFPNHLQQSRDISADSSQLPIANGNYNQSVLEDQDMSGINTKRQRQDYNYNLHTAGPDTSINYQNVSQIHLNTNGNLIPTTIHPQIVPNYNPYNDAAPKLPKPYNHVPVNTSLELQGMSYSKSPLPGKSNVLQGRPMNTNAVNQLFSSHMSGLDKLRLLSRIFVKQKFEMLEMLTGCETENRYKVYAADEGLERVGRPIFKCKEKSSFMARNCLR